jgi:hypothetical protein
VMAGNAIACCSANQHLTGHTIIRAWIVPPFCVLISHKDIAVGAATRLCLPSFVALFHPAQCRQLSYIDIKLCMLALVLKAT